MGAGLGDDLQGLGGRKDIVPDESGTEVDLKQNRLAAWFAGDNFSLTRN
jgi:hypothetical protein